MGDHVRFTFAAGGRFGFVLWLGLLALPLVVAAGCAHQNGRQHAIAEMDDDDDGVASTQPALVTGRFLADHLADATQDVGSLPINMVPSADGHYVLTTDMGSRQALCAIRTSDGKGTGRIDFPNSGPAQTASNGLYYGLAVAGDVVYAAQGHHEAMAMLKLGPDGSLQNIGAIPTKVGDFPAGLALDGRGMLYVTNNDPVGATPLLKVPASVAIYDTKSAQEIGRYMFGDTIAGSSNFPLAAAALNDGSRLYVASQRDGCVYVLDTRDPHEPRLLRKIASGSHPAALLLDRAQSKLFIANAHSDTVSIVDVARDDAIMATILLRPEIAKDLPGATPTGLALSPDEHTLYVALGDMNAVGVIDVSAASLRGYLPAGWYPTGVAVSPDGKRLLVANAKGTAARNPNVADYRTINSEGRKYILRVIEGNVTTVGVPDGEQLRAQTNRVLHLNRLIARYVKAENPLKSIGLQAGKIRHVIYIVKENRTYDQVLGDMPQGNGEKNLCIFGREVTPNLHALAERFVLLDNFYASGEVSGDGWVWSTQGHANEYVIKNVPYSYSKRGRKFDYEGVVNDYPAGGFPAQGPDGKPLAEDDEFRAGGPAITDVAEAPGGHIWDLVRKHGLTYRNYGFFSSHGVKKGAKMLIPDNYPASAGLQPGGHDLEGVTDVDFRKFDLEFPDSDAPYRYFEETKDKVFLRPRATYGKDNLPSRFSEWNREFQLMLAKDPSGGAVPNFMTLRLGTDHTVGANPLRHSPRSFVADNDYAIGQLVEAVSHSPIWKSTAIFIVEDDAQNGPDHVDAHRSTCYVVSPWIKKGIVDHTFHNTVSLLKTMECLMGLPPMCQNDAVVTPILDWDAAPANDAAYKAILPSKELIAQTNAASNPPRPVSPELKAMIEQSEAMDFTVADRAPADQLTRIIWQTVKGPGAVMPDSPRGPSPDVRAVKHDDDDDD
jgi:DNA-binding beta-propeller fold protein YncE